MSALDVPALEAFVAALDAAVDGSASLDATEVRTPGVLVRLAELEQEVGEGYPHTIRVRMYLVVKSSSDTLRVLRNLSDLLDQVVAVVTPTGASKAVEVAMPSGTVLPGLDVPTTLYPR